MTPVWNRAFIRACLLAGTWFVTESLTDPAVAAQDPLPMPENSPATTEFNCSFGMEKNESRQSCQVPIPPGCVVASFPGTAKPWTNISRGGNTQCRFDDTKTDWKTRITGTCGKCRTGHCSVQFIVKFDCSKR